MFLVIGMLNPGWIIYLLPDPYCRYQHTCLGFRQRMSPPHAAIVRIQLKSLDEKNQIRKENIEMLLTVLDELPGFKIYRAPSCIKRVYYENINRYEEEETGLPLESLI